MTQRGVHMVANRIELPLPISTLATLRWFAAKCAPYEACGTIHKNFLVTQYDNTYSGDRRHGFDMEVALEDPELLAIWHSHPTGPDCPSRDDIPSMELMALHGFNFPWVIVTPDAITRWTLGVPARIA